MATWSMRPWNGANRSLRAPMKIWPQLSGNVGVRRPSISGSRATVQVHSHQVALTHQHDVIPGVQRQQRRAREQFVPPVAVEDDQTAGGVGGPADAQVLAGRFGGAVLAAREEVPRHGPGVDGQLVPDPHLDGVVPRQSGEDRFQPPAGEIRRLGIRTTNLRAVPPTPLRSRVRWRRALGVARLRARSTKPAAGSGGWLRRSVPDRPEHRAGSPGPARFSAEAPAAAESARKPGNARRPRPPSRPACTRRCRPACLPACCRGRGGPRRTTVAPAAA